MFAGMKGIIIRLKYAIIALRLINRPHLGDIVFYNGERCGLIQGVRSPYWDLMPLSEENMARDKREIYKDVHETSFSLRPIYRRFLFSFRFTYQFMMTNWYKIELQNGPFSIKL